MKRLLTEKYRPKIISDLILDYELQNILVKSIV